MDIGLWFILLLLVVGVCLVTRCFGLRRCRYRRRRSRTATFDAMPTREFRSRRKPTWVTRELVRIAALSSDLGCRVVAEIFNRQFAERRVVVSKSFVALVMRRHHSEIAHVRRSTKHRIPRPGPTNRTWGMDLTGKADLSGRQRVILGMLDHGSRAALQLSELADKRSLTILREVIEAIRRYGVPQRIRVDNEACFVSATLRTALGLLGIRLQRIRPHCPWQNGRIERFFGTLKQRLDRIAIVDSDDLRTKLAEFRCWYNHARPHQHLFGRKPAEAWSGREKAIGTPTRLCAWDGRLVGWFFPP